MSAGVGSYHLLELYTPLGEERDEHVRRKSDVSQGTDIRTRRSTRESAGMNDLARDLNGRRRGIDTIKPSP